MALVRKWMVVMCAWAMLLASACASKTSSSPPPAAVTEWDFVADPTLRLEPGQVGVTFLEPSDGADGSTPDSGTVGVDVMPLNYAETVTETFAMDPADPNGTVARVELFRVAPRTSLLTLTPLSPAATVTLAPGEYELVIHAGYDAASTGGATQTLFLVPNGPVAVKSRPGVPAARATSSLAGTGPGRWLSNNACPGCNLQAVDLAFANLRGAVLPEADLMAANLRGAYMQQAFLPKAVLLAADLTGTRLAEANLSGARLDYVSSGDARDDPTAKRDPYSGVDLSGADLSGARLIGATLRDANLTRARLDGAKAMSGTLVGGFTTMQRALLDETDLTSVDLGQVELTGASMRRANLKAVAWLEGKDLRWTDLTLADLSGANLMHASLAGANLCRSVFAGAWLVEANLLGAKLKGAVFTGAYLTGAIWRDGSICTSTTPGCCHGALPCPLPVEDVVCTWGASAGQGGHEE